MPILAPLIVALIPLLITPSLLYYFDITPKVVALLLGAAAALLLYRQNARNLAGLLSVRAGRWFTSLVAVYWALFAISTAVSTNRALSFFGGTWRRFGLITETALLVFVVLAAAWLAQDPRHVRTLLRAVCVSGGAGALYGIAQYFGFDPLLPSHAYQSGEGPFTIVRPPGTMGHADYFAAWLVFVVFCSIALSQVEERRVVPWMVAAIAPVAIVLSGTRAALLGLFAGAIVLAAGRNFVANVAIVTAIFGVALLLLIPAGQKLRARMHWSLEDARGGARLLLWRDTLRMIPARPVFGFGPETFSTEFPRFQSIDLARAYPDFYHESPHNVFLDAAVEEGAPQALVLLALSGLALYAARRTPFAAGLIAMLVCLQFSAPVVGTALALFLMLSVCLAQAFLPVCPESARKTTQAGMPVLLGMPILLFFAISLVLGVSSVQLLVADQARAVADQRFKAGDPAAAARAYQQVLRWQPPGSGSDLEYSRAMAALATHSPIFRTRTEAGQQAVDAAVRATRTAEDRQNAWYNLATVLAVQNDTKGVERSLRNAIQWAPNWFKPHWTLAQLLEMTNRHQDAVAEARFAVDLNEKDPEVIATWIKLTGKGRQ